VNPIVAFVMTLVEAILTLLLVRPLYRLLRRATGRRVAESVPQVS